MKLLLKTLTPVHIGNGEKYNGLSYVEDIFANPKKVFIVEFDRIKKILNKRELESFTNWVVSEDYPSWFKYCKFALNKPQIQNEFKKTALYTLNNYSAEKYLRDIDCFIKQNNKPYIPGTEIKGAIRTAVAYHLLQNEGHWKYFKKELEKFGNNYRKELQQIPGQKGRWVNDVKKKLTNEMGKIEEELQTRLFRAENNNDAKFDLLKLLSIGDTELKDPNICLVISNLTVEGISRTFQIFQELCKANTSFTCQGFRLENNTTIINKLGFTPEQKWVISDIKNILQCCYEFSDRLLQEEIVFFKRLNKLQIVAKLQNIQKQNTPDSPVIRIGKNEGYFSLTMGLLVKDRDKVLYDNVLCHATKNTSYTGNFPKTRRIVNVSNNEQDTLGWVKLIIHE